MNLNDLATKEDLRQFKDELFELLKQFNVKHQKPESSNEVRNILKISAGTLQNLRIKGTPAYSRVGGIIYYKLEDVMQLRNKHEKSNCRFLSGVADEIIQDKKLNPTHLAFTLPC